MIWITEDEYLLIPLTRGLSPNWFWDFFSEMAILWGFLRYTTKGQKFWPYGLFKAARPKRPKKILKPSMAQNA